MAEWPKCSGTVLGRRPSRSLGPLEPCVLTPTENFTYLNDPTLADAILDRVAHSSHKIDLKATKSMRDTAEGSASGGPAGA